MTDIAERNLGRRPVLKGLAAGVAGTAAAPAAYATVQGAPETTNLTLDAHGVPSVLVLSTDTPHDASFLTGVQLACTARGWAAPTVLHWNLAEFGCFQAALVAAMPTILVGLVEDGDAAVILELARSAGARLTWLGQHRDPADSTTSRHRVLTAGATGQGCATRFAERLDVCAVGFELAELPLNTAARRRTAAGAAGNWAMALGTALLASHGPGPAPATERPLPSRDWNVRGRSFVSFSLSV